MTMNMTSNAVGLTLGHLGRMSRPQQLLRMFLTQPAMYFLLVLKSFLSSKMHQKSSKNSKGKTTADGRMIQTLPNHLDPFHRKNSMLASLPVCQSVWANGPNKSNPGNTN